MWVVAGVVSPFLLIAAQAIREGLDLAEINRIAGYDMWFLDRIATHILAYEGTDEAPDKWYWFEGNFEAYEQNKIERLGVDAATPHRSTHRKLTRD